MPYPIHTPENRDPKDEDLLVLVQRQPGISLREICGHLWPDLLWYAFRPSADSVARRVRQNGVTAATYIEQRMDRLVQRGLVRKTIRPDEVDDQARQAYEPIGGVAVLPPEVQAVPEDDDGRCGAILPGEDRAQRRKRRDPYDEAPWSESGAA